MEHSNSKLTSQSLPGSKILDYETANKTDNLSQLQDILRDSFIQYKETAQRCQIQFKQKAQGEQFNRLYYTPNVPFLDEPEKQREYRNAFIKDVGQLPEPKPLICMADQLHADALEALGDCSDPKVVREQLVQFFTRRSAQLQHKKHKIIKRWADAYLTAEDIDKVQDEFDKELSYIQIEQDSVASRLMRLSPDDRYSNQPQNVDRPKPTGVSSSIQSRTQNKDEQQALLYAEIDREQPNASALRQDDFEVFIRQKTYLNRVLRPSRKLIQSLKWLSHDQRYEIWGDSRILMHEYQQKFAQDKFKVLFTVAEEVKRKLAEIGIVDEKGVSVCTERYVFHLKGKGFTTRTQQMLNSHKFDHQEPHMLVASLAELKFHLIQLASEYGLNCSQVELDKGQQLTYQLQTFYPGKFESQINSLTFDWEDSGNQTELQILERLTKNLNLSKDAMIEELSKRCAEQRQNSILTALNVGKTGQSDATLKDLTENALDKDQFIRHNLIRKLRTIEFFSLDETDTRIRKADWLEYVCWQPTINIHVQRQNQLLSGTSNHIDHLLKTAIDFTDVQDSVTVNKVLEESAEFHIKKITEVQVKIAQCQGAPNNLKGSQKEGEALIQTLHQATNPSLARNQSKVDPNLNEAQQFQFNKFSDVPNVDPLPLNLTKAFYTLRLIKTRDIKIQMLHVLNYFRAIQRILAFDVRENMTREKGLGEYSNIIDPHFGKNGDGQSIAKQQPPSGPSDIFNSNIIRDLDTVQKFGEIQLDPVTLKAYKLKNRFETLAISTCPLVPKHHRTFGQKIGEQSVSAEIDDEHFNSVHRQKAHSLITKRDRIHVDFQTRELYVTNEFGSRIIYYEAFNDLVEIEDELVKIGSYYINQHEIMIQNNEIMELQGTSRPTSLIDRAQIALELMEKEYNFQFAKIKIVEQLMQAYEHIYDPLESLRVLQIIVDLVAERPRLNLEATMFSESYDSEIQLLNTKADLFADFLQMQKDIEREQNQAVQDYLELRHRKISEQIDGYWIEVAQKQKKQKIGSEEPANEDQDDQEDISELLRQKLEQTQLQATSKREALDRIKKRHITEFANEQFQDFAQVLGLPQVTTEELYKRFDQKEPIIIDALRENAFFQKMVEGYPVKFKNQSSQSQQLGLHFDAGLTDFFDSMLILSKFNAVLVQAFQDIEKETQPENGFAVSCLENCMYNKAKLILIKRRAVTDEGIDSEDLKGQHFFEEDFYFGYSEKLIQLMKELHIEFHPENLYSRSNPLVASKLDIQVSYLFLILQSVQGFNFPRIKSKEIIDSLTQEGVQETRLAEFITQKTIQIANQVIARPSIITYNSIDQFTNMNQPEKIVKVPSLMIMCCNLFEIIRLREEIILRMHESRVLGRIYSNQCSQSSKPTKFSFSDQIQFNVNQLMKECVNLIDINEGSILVFDQELPFMEYDRSLAANLDFKSGNCVKALLQDMGVAELRSILHLQIAQQQLLTVAVKLNQILSDKAQKGLQELDLIEKKEITVPNSIVDLSSILGNSMDSHNIAAIKSERTRMRQVLTKSISDCFYMILPKKSRERANIQKRFTQILSRINNNSDLAAKPEVALRILRSYRLQQCQSYCAEIIQEAQKDSLKIQILETCNTLRLRATLLPAQCQIFRLGKSETQENLSFDSHQFLTHIEEYKISETKIMNIHSILGGHGICSQAQTIFYIPGAEEVCLCDRMSNSEQSFRTTKEFTADGFSLEKADQFLKTPYSKVFPLQNIQYKIDEGKQQYGVRKVYYQESLPLANFSTYNLLVYFTQILNIFDLEFSMLRNCSKSSQVMELEDKTQTGRPFWSQIRQEQKELERRQHKEHTADDSLIQNKFSYKVIQKLNERKKAWIDLIEDLQRITDRMAKLEQQVQKLQSERRNINYICDLLTLQHQTSFYTFLNGIENMLEYYLDKNNNECFHKILEIRDLATNRNTNSIILIRSNGFFASNANLNPLEIDIDENDTQSYFSFKQQHQPVIDEKALMPKQTIIIPRIFGKAGQYKKSLQQAGYNTLIKSAFYNLDDEHRRLIGVNFTQLDELVNDFLMFKGLLENPFDNKAILRGKDYAQEVLLAQAEILSLKIEASNLERVVIAWSSDCGNIPKSILKFKQLQRKFRDQNTLKILTERDQMNDNYWAKQKKNNPGQRSRQEQEKELIGGLTGVQQTKQSYYSKVNQLRAEIKVTKNFLELAMVKDAIKMIRNEHSAILACFEISAQDRDINLFVHPSQQFASTMYIDVDRIPHLDVVTKIGCLQQFLTRLRNRCTEVETLTSGPGIVFSMKDFNDCLSIFAKQLIKYSEEELRGRCETQSLREHQYHHLIYIKQMETLYYKQKCEQFLKNIDQIVNSKMFSRGNQMIYELDLTSRELQTLKDHYYIMEKCLREDIRLDYMKDLDSKGILIKKQKDDFTEFRKQLNNELSEEVAQQINDLDQLVRMKGHQGSMQSFKPIKGSGRTDPQLLSEIKYLTDSIRKHKILHMFKTAVAQQKHERELAEQKQKLTQNQGLWDSLAEAEKREQITAQELALTKQNLTHYERLIEKLYTQLEHLNNQKIRLEQFKKSKSKRIDELEGKMKDLEILENIDLNKILEEIRTRDNKIKRLDKVDQSFNERINQIQNAHNNQVDEMKRLLAAERQAKNQAYEKLDAMRVEMKTLEGKDSVKNDLWKEKCKELYDICRDLEVENQNLKSAVKDLQDLTQKQQLELQQKNTVNQSQSDISEFSYGKPNSREALILQRRQFQQKPFTAENSKPQRGFSAGRIGGYSAKNRQAQSNLLQSMNNIQPANPNNLNVDRYLPNTIRSTTLQTNDIRQALARGPILANAGSLTTTTAADGFSTNFGMQQHHPIILKQPSKLLASQQIVPHIHSALKQQNTISDTSSVENNTQIKNIDQTLRKSHQGIQMSAQGFSIKHKSKEE